MKLLTEAEARDLYKCVADASDLVRLLRKRGMVAPEPVDPLREAVREAWRARWPADSASYIDRFTKELRARGVTVLAERPTLTREMVSEVVEIAARLTPMRETFVDCVYALLVERLK
jgi:hypothetical protein